MKIHKIKILPFFILLAGIVLCSFIKASVKEGEISHVGDVIKIEVSTNESPVYGIFSWDKGLNPWVRVYGEKKKLIDNIDLSTTQALILQGGGKFLLELYSEKGTGRWTCKFVNEKHYTDINKENE